MQNFLKRLRKARGITLKQLSRESGWGVSTINNFENGRTGASRDFLQEMARILKVHVSLIVPVAGDSEALRDAVAEEEGESVAIGFRKDLKSEEGLRAMFTHVLDTMPLSLLIERLSEIVNDTSKTADLRLEMAQAIMPVIERRKAELEAELAAAKKAEKPTQH